MNNTRKLVRGTFETVVPKFEPDSFDCIVIDPPFGVDYAGNRMYDDRESTVFSNYRAWMEQCSRVLKPGGHIYIFVPTKYLDRWITVTREFFTFKNVIATRNYTMFVKWKPMKNNFTYLAQFIVFASKGEARDFREVDWIKKTQSWLKDKRNQSESEYTYLYPNFITQFRASVKANHQVKKLHPNEKNVELVQFLVEISTKEGELVGDFFAGVGTTGVACVRTNRSFVLVEKNRKYYQIAKERLKSSCVEVKARQEQTVTNWIKPRIF